ncbi:MAG: energy transducer TonB [Elusimicrobia bacterium]|nr:energy transducer TonB [Elusimicrobiota bacterium]
MSEGALLWLGMGASACVHSAVAAGVLLLPPAGPSRTVAFDLTNPVRMSAPKPRARSAAAAPRPKPKAEPAWPAPGPAKPETAAAPEPPPEPEQASTGQASADAAQGPAASAGSAGPAEDGARFTVRPRLLNLRELAVVLRRSYPARERAAGIQGTVILDLALAEDGRVTEVKVVGSAGSAFDEAALGVAKLLRYSPAKVGRLAVACRIRQAIAFKLGV